MKYSVNQGYFSSFVVGGTGSEYGPARGGYKKGKIEPMSDIIPAYGWNASMEISLYDKIRQDMKQAMIHKDTDVRDTMRLIIGAYPNLTVSMTLESGKKTTRVKTPDEITDDDILDIIRKFAKSEKTVLEIKKQSTSDYLELLNTYLPQMATPAEIKQWIQDNVDFSKFKSPMQAMGAVMKHFGKQADGNLVKKVLKDIGNS
ncbi:GatB/YqeY domain-containing protein [Desulfocicer vacuolatum]|nr:GatB/YqeY domain-containing protein [Desulfocicer vacuolatum]